jgi:hypothetical protein
LTLSTTGGAPSASPRVETVRPTRIGELERIDGVLVDLAARGLDPAAAAALEREADAELAPFVERMAADAYAAARRLACIRLLREAAGLPIVSFE